MDITKDPDVVFHKNMDVKLLLKNKALEDGDQELLSKVQLLTEEECTGILQDL